MRITTQMMMSRYRSDVSDAFASMNIAMRRAYDYRAFEKPSDSPLAAAQTFQVHWEARLNADYRNNISNLEGANTTADHVLQQIATQIDTAKEKINSVVTDTANAQNREDIANELASIRQSMLSELNSKYADSYLFGGSNAGTAPFTLDADGNLLYRGVNVDTGVNTNGATAALTYTEGETEKALQIDFGKAVGGKLDGYNIQITAGGAFSADVDTDAKSITITAGTDATRKDLQEYLQSDSFQSALPTGLNISAEDVEGITVAGNPDGALPAGNTDSAEITDKVDLEALAKDHVYVDIGLGIESGESGAATGQSAFDSAMPGIRYVGYGTDENGVPKNVFSLLKDIEGYLKDDSVSVSELVEELNPYRDALQSAEDTFISSKTDIGARGNFLEETDSYLEAIGENLSEKDNQVEYVDFEDAITSFSTQQYCYLASLQVGSKVLQTSLMDYLR